MAKAKTSRTTKTADEAATKALADGKPIKTATLKARTLRGEDHAAAANRQAERVAAYIQKNEKAAAKATEGRKVAARTPEQYANPKTAEAKFGPDAKSKEMQKAFDNADLAQARGLDENMTVGQYEAQARRAALGL